ncbi:MAG: hypothetical protein JWN87_460, partial [Frankiales bacterium]|nr:hypothetical protein [Frankiales bacterium]
PAPAKAVRPRKSAAAPPAPKAPSTTQKEQA